MDLKIPFGMSHLNATITDDNSRVLMKVDQSGMEVGELVYENGEVVWIHVEPFFRRQGLASNMIACLQETGLTVTMPDAKTKDGNKFFESMQNTGKLDEVRSSGAWSPDRDRMHQDSMSKINDRLFDAIGSIGDVEILYKGMGGAGRYVFRKNGTIVGYADTIEDSLDEVGNYSEMMNIYLDTSIRGAGFGYAFYEFVMSRGLSLMSDTSQSDGAKGLWAKLARNYVTVIDDGYEGFISINAMSDIAQVYADNGSTLIVTPKKRPQPLSEAAAPWLRITPTMIDQAKGMKCQVIVDIPATQFLQMTTAPTEVDDDSRWDVITQGAATLTQYNQGAKAGHDSNYRDMLNQGKTSDDRDYRWGTIHMPWLTLRFNDDGSQAAIVGHEGRHRTAASLQHGNKMVRIALQMKPGRDMLPEINHGVEYHITSEHIPATISGQYDHKSYSTAEWQVVDGDLQKHTRRYS